MGKNIQIKVYDNLITLGADEDLYNTRLDQLYKLVADGHVEQVPGSLLPEEYLKPEVWTYRFPFPDEDGLKMGEFEPYNRGVTINLAQRGWKIIDMLVNGEWIHNTITHTIEGKTINGVPCPWIPEGGDIWRALKRIEPIVELVGTKLMEDGRDIWPVLRCPYCGSTLHLWNYMGGVLARAAAHNEPTPFYAELAMRIRKGYSVNYNLERYYHFYKDGKVYDELGLSQ